MTQMEAMAPRAVPKKYTHIMIDMETLGLTADAVILSIGAVKFNLDGEISDKCLYGVCDIESQLRRHINGGTLAWWMEQHVDAKNIFRDGVPLAHVLENMRKFVDHEDYFVWSNGADFDIPLLSHALRTHDMQPLFKHWNHRCFRTIKEEYKSCPKPPFEGTKHNALMDAIYQAKWLIDIYKFKSNPPEPKGFMRTVK